MEEVILIYNLRLEGSVWGQKVSRWDHVNKLLDSLYGTLNGSVSWEDAMRTLTRFTDSERIIMMTVGRDGAVRQDSYPFDPAGVVEFAEHYAGKDKRILQVQQGLRGVYTTQDLMTPEEIARCPIHNEFYRKYPECWNTLIVAGEVDGVSMTPIFQRGANLGLFEEDDRRFADMISGHLMRISQLQGMASLQELTHSGIVAALDGLADGLIIFDETGQVLHMNEAAQRLVDAKDGIELYNRVPVASHPASRPLFARMITDILSIAGEEQYTLPAPVTLPRPSSARPLKVRGFVAPPQEGHRRLGLLTIQSEGSWRLPSVEAVQAASGLTPAEARVAHALLDGQTLREYAERTGLSEHTVRFQLKRVREKLGVTRQAAVVSALMRLCGLE